MKRLSTSILSFIICLIVSAQYQYYNPYRAYQYINNLQQQMMQDNQNAYKLGAAHAAVLLGFQYITSGKYKSALEQFEKAYEEYNYVPALEHIGICYELGIGTNRDTQWADVQYEAGAKANNKNCKAALRRIQSNGHWPTSYKTTYIQKIRAQYGQYHSAPNMSSGYSGTNRSNSSSSVHTTCRICGGSGVCTSCHGKRGEFVDTGTYTGRDTQSWIDCPSCKGNGKCFNCYGTGRQ